MVFSLRRFHELFGITYISSSHIVRSKMSFGFSIGDIILCSQITYRLFVAATSGRKHAPRGLRELEDILIGLNCSLNHLQRTSIAVLSDHVADEVQDQLGFMLHSCRRTLEDLETTTAKYFEAGKRPALTSDCQKGPRLSSHGIVTQVKKQWRRFVWDLQGESLTKYRRKLQSHTDALNLFLGTLIWFVLTLTC